MIEISKASVEVRMRVEECELLMKQAKKAKDEKRYASLEGRKAGLLEAMAIYNREEE